MTLLAAGTTSVLYRLDQRFTYDYDGPVRRLQHRLVVLPPQVHGDQRLHDGSVSVSAPADVGWSTDRFGNRHCVVRMAEVPARLELAVAAVVERGPGVISHQPGRAGGSLFRAPTALTAADGRIEELARRHAVAGDELATADAYCGLVHERIRYAFDATDVTTTAAEALTIGAGEVHGRHQQQPRALRLDRHRRVHPR